MKINKVVLDTNVLMSERDIFEDLDKFLWSYEAIVPSFIVDELNKKATKGKQTEKKKAKIGLKLLDNVKVVEVQNGKKSVDTALMDFAKKEGAYVYTNDKKLKKRLEKNKVPVIFLRGTQAKKSEK